MSDAGNHGTAMTDELRSAACAVRALRNVLGAPRTLAKIAALPWLLTLGTLSAYSMMQWDEPLLSSFALAILAVPLGALGHGWLRGTLLERPPRFLAAAPWRRNAFGAMIYSLLCLVWMLAMPMLLKVVFDALLTAGGPFFELTLTFGFCYIALGLYLSARLLLATPAIAVGRAVSPADAWRLSAGRSLGVFGGLCLIAIVILLACMVAAVAYELGISSLFFLLDLPSLSLWLYWWLPSSLEVISSFGLTVGAAVLAQYLALVYRALTGWRGPQREVLERFD